MMRRRPKTFHPRHGFYAQCHPDPLGGPYLQWTPRISRTAIKRVPVLANSNGAIWPVDLPRPSRLLTHRNGSTRRNSGCAAALLCPAATASSRLKGLNVSSANGGATTRKWACNVIITGSRLRRAVSRCAGRMASVRLNLRRTRYAFVFGRGCSTAIFTYRPMPDGPRATYTIEKPLSFRILLSCQGAS